MLEELKITISILRNQKNNLIKDLDKKDNIKEKDEILNNIFKIDTKLNEYIQKINEKNPLENNKINDENNNKQSKEINNLSKEIKTTKNNDLRSIEDDEIEMENKSVKLTKNNNPKKNNRKSNSISLENKANKIKKMIKLTDNTIEEIRDKKGKCRIEINNKELNIMTIYTFKSATKTTYYYQCNKRPNCNGKGKYDFIKEKFYITNECDKNIPHNELKYEKIYYLFENNQYQKVDFSLKKNQKYLVEYIFNKLNKENNIDIKKEFSKYKKEKFLMTNVEISKIKNKIYGKLNSLSLEVLSKKNRRSKLYFRVIYC